MKKLALYMSSTHMPQKADWLSCVTVAADAGFDGLELFGARYAREADMTAGHDCPRRAGAQFDAVGPSLDGMGRSAAGCAFAQA